MTAPALVLDAVSKAFRGRRALDDVSLRVDLGEVVAMIGLNGAGKTTALRILAGRLRPDAGTARTLGTCPASMPGRVAVRFAQVVDAPLVRPELTVVENLRAAALLHGLPRSAAPPAALAAVDRLALGPWSHARARTLSAGNLQRLGIACGTVHTPRAVILDEPTNALDPSGVVLLRELIRDLAADGAGVLVSSHHLDEVSRVADRIVVVHAGRVVGELEPGGVDLERRFFAMVLAADTQAGATTPGGGS